MEEYFAEFPISDVAVLCVGGVTRAEAEEAEQDGLYIDGLGYYLFLASQAEPKKPIEILAKFASAGAAERLARAFTKASPPPA